MVCDADIHHCTYLRWQSGSTIILYRFTCGAWLVLPHLGVPTSNPVSPFSRIFFLSYSMTSIYLVSHLLVQIAFYLSFQISLLLLGVPKVSLLLGMGHLHSSCSLSRWNLLSASCISLSDSSAFSSSYIPFLPSMFLTDTFSETAKYPLTLSSPEP